MIFKNLAIYAKDYVLASEAISKLNSLDGNIALDETYLDIIKGLNEEQAKLALSTTRLSKTKQEQLLIDAGLSSLSEEIAIDKAKECIVNAELNNEIKESIIEKIAEAGASDIQADGSKVVSREKLKEIILTSELNEEEKEAILVNLGYGTSNLALAATFKKLTFEVWGTIKSIGKFIAMNPWTWVVMGVAAIAGLSYAFDSYRKKVRETAEEAKNSIDEIKSSYEDLSSTVNDVKSRYAELAQNVGNLGKLNQNAGGLNTEEYEEFLDLSNQLSELFPQLTKGYDENGNAILNLSGNVDTIVGSLNNLVKVQKDLANQEILEKMPEVWDGYALEVNEYQRELDNAKAFQNSFEKELNGMLTRSENTQIAPGRYNEMYDIFDELGLDLHDYFVSNSSLGYTTLDFSELSEEDAAKIERYWSRLSKEYLDQEQNAQLQIDFANTEMQKYIQTWFNSNSAYSSETDLEKNQIMQYLMSSFDLGVFKEKLDGKDWDEVTTWIEESILFAISNVDNENVENAMLKLLTGDYDSIPELEELYNLIQSYFSPDDPIMLYFEANYGSLNDSYNSVVDKAAQKFTRLNQHNINSAYDYQRLESEKQALDEFAKENSINTQEEIAFWNKCIEESDTREEAMQKYLNENSEELSKVEFSPTDFSAQMETLSSINSLYQEFRTNLNDTGEFKPFDINDIESLREKIGGFVNDFDEFERVLTSSKSTADDVQRAFDQIGTEFIVNSNALKGLNSETRDQIVSQLELNGLTNAGEVITEDLAKAYDELTAVGYDMSEVTAEQALELINEAKVSDQTRQALYRLQLAEIMLDSTKIDTSDEVEALINMAEAAGATTESIIAVSKATAWLTGANGMPSWVADMYKKPLTSDMLKFDTDFLKLDEITSDAGSAGSSAGDAYKEAFEREIKDLQWLRDMGVINEKEYLDKLRALNHKYFKDKAKYLEEYRQYEKEYYDGMLNVMNTVITAVTDTLDEQIEQLEEQKTSIEESYSLQIEAIQETIEGLQEENEEMDKNMALQKSRYNLMRSLYQRTRLIKFMSDIIVI